MDQILVRVGLGEHAEQIGSLADRILEVGPVQHVLVPETVRVRVRLHLELEVFDQPETERTVPAYFA